MAHIVHKQLAANVEIKWCKRLYRIELGNLAHKGGAVDRQLAVRLDTYGERIKRLDAFRRGGHHASDGSLRNAYRVRKVIERSSVALQLFPQ